MAPNKLLNRLEKRAKKNPKKIVFPEALDERVLRAAELISKKGIAKPVLLGSVKTILDKTKALNIRLKAVEIIDHQKSPRKNYYAKKLYEIRRKKGVSLVQAKALLRQEIYFGTMMVYCGDADGLISGAVHPTAHTLRPAFQIIKTKEHFHKVSGAFLMVKGKDIYLFADAAVNVDPTAEELAEIAIDTSETAKAFGLKPRIAMLSFSTKGSADHPLVDKVRKATALARKKKPRLIIDGEMQVDAALVPSVCRIKCPGCRLCGNANVLIFPDLQSANISYKLVERIGHTKAIGPLLQGLTKPINDLSRGCDVEDILNLTIITVIQAQNGL